MRFKYRLGLTFAAAVLNLVCSSSSDARPEYATKEKANCVACHANPWGGGPRNVFGKVYGSHGFNPAKTSSLDLYYADVRFIDYLPTTKTTQRPNGLALMEAAVTGNVSIIQGEGGSEMRGVLTYNMSPLAGSQVREAYLRFQLATEGAAIPTYFMVGRFYVPFGLLTDEHRTYTRLQTNSMFNNYDVGGAISWNFNPDWHGDFALVNDFQTGGNFTAADLTLGAVLNTRWNPRQLPFLLGISGNFQKTTKFPQPFAISEYGVLSFDRLTQNKISANLSLEAVEALNWNNPTLNNGQINPGLATFFTPGGSTDPYIRSIAYKQSRGYYALFKYNLTHVWTPFYKLDYINLDTGSESNQFLRHGFGVEAYLNSNLILNVRYEYAYVARPEIVDTNVLATQTDIFAMLRFWM
ncbi:MAG: hypothetical protein ACJ763_10405 [Bdellovibrionia bacterium]